jgi:phospholipase C
VNAYGPKALDWPLDAGETLQQFFSLEATFGWYDFTLSADDAAFGQQLAGHLENGRDSFSDPAMPVK